MIEVESRIGKDSFRCICPFPDHDESVGSMIINKTDNWYHCFGCGRHGRYEELTKRFGVLAPIRKRMCRLKNSRKETPNTGVVDRGINYLIQRGFILDTIQKYHVYHNEKTKRLDIPILDCNGIITGIASRTTVGEDPKYRYSFGFERNVNLFGIDKINRELENVYVVEGPLDSMWMNQCGFQSVAVLGSIVSNWQINEILDLCGNNTVTLCFDNDEAGKKAEETVGRKLLGKAHRVYVISIPSGMDVQNLSKEDLVRTIAERKLFLTRYF